MPTMKAINAPSGIPSRNQRCGRRHNHAAKPRRIGAGEFTSNLWMRPLATPRLIDYFTGFPFAGAQIRAHRLAQVFSYAMRD